MAKNGASTRRNTAGLAPPWQPGQSGNPSGRPKGSGTLTAKLLAHPPEDFAALDAKLWELALAGDKDCIKYIYDRCEGKPMQRIEFTLEDAREMARRLAQEYGEDAELAVAEVEAIMRGESR